MCLAGMARFSCHDPHHVYDLIPCDTVASVILLAAAAASAEARSAASALPLPMLLSTALYIGLHEFSGCLAACA